MKFFRYLLLAMPFHPLSSEEMSIPWKNQVRVKTLHNMDLLLHWGIGKKQEPFSLFVPRDEELLTLSFPALEAFSTLYGYFSPARPLVGNVSKNPVDLDIVYSLFHNLPAAPLSFAQQQLVVAELLAKVLAYRDLQQGQSILIPQERDGAISLERFTVHHLFDIWQGMPAFGLLPEKEDLPSLLLFRGTDFSLLSKRGIASLMSDLDPAGPGLHAFFHARHEIHEWLCYAHSLKKPARVLGFSLGGALAAYTFIYENALLSEQSSLSLCAPGVSSTVIEEWKKLSLERQACFVSYVNAGDLVSQVGLLFGEVYCLSTNKPLKPLTAHTALMSTQTPLYKTRIRTTISESQAGITPLP